VGNTPVSPEAFIHGRESTNIRCLLVGFKPVSLARFSTFTLHPLGADVDTPKQRLIELTGKGARAKSEQSAILVHQGVSS